MILVFPVWILENIYLILNDYYIIVILDTLKIYG